MHSQCILLFCQYLGIDTDSSVTLENRRGVYLFRAHSVSTQLTANKEILIDVTRKQARGHSVVSFGSGKDHVSDSTDSCTFAAQVLIA